MDVAWCSCFLRLKAANWHFSSQVSLLHPLMFYKEIIPKPKIVEVLLGKDVWWLFLYWWEKNSLAAADIGTKFRQRKESFQWGKFGSLHVLLLSLLSECLSVQGCSLDQRKEDLFLVEIIKCLFQCNKCVAFSGRWDFITILLCFRTPAGDTKTKLEVSSLE